MTFNPNDYQALQGRANIHASDRVASGMAPTSGAVNGALAYTPRPSSPAMTAPLSSMSAHLPQGSQPARETFAGASHAGTGSFRPASGGQESAAYLHARDHLRMQPDHPAVSQPVLASDYNRIRSQAEAGCPQCQGFVAGAKMVWNGKAAREKQDVLKGKAETPSEQRMQRSLQDQIRRAGDSAAKQLIPQPGETVCQLIARAATARAHAERQVRQKWGK